MKKFENFCNALINLEKINDYSEPYDTVVLTGLVGLFEICFEQAWKAMKEILEDNGFSEGRTGSPKQILKTAYSAGMIDDEEMWLKALQSRNNVTHSYNEDIALDIVRSTRECYYGLFKRLEAEIKDNFL
ncbi:MAG: nucleotidyltransferase substrate binding protein [Lachnospiraceae bacterium]|nr:nucleotidyltransferase substrate binding protein [Lachnospiraceae bacterium]